MRNRTWKAAALLMCALGGWAQAHGQIRIGATDGSATIKRHIVKKDSPAQQREADKQSCLQYMAKAEEYFSQGKHFQACQQLNRAKRLLVTRELAEKCGALAVKINAAGYEQIKLGDEALAREEYRKAIRIYLVASRTYLELPAAQAARRRLTEIEKDPTIAAAMAEEQAAQLLGSVTRILQSHRERVAAKAAADLAKATTTRPAGQPEAPQATPAPPTDDLKTILTLDDADLLRAAELLGSVVQRYPAVPAAKRAAGLLQAIQADARCKKRLQQLRTKQQARQDLAKANTYASAGLLEKAAQLYREVIEKHPGTPQALTAATQLGIVEAKLAAR